MKKAVLTVLGALFALLLLTPSSALASAPPPVTDDVDAVSTVVIAAPLVTLIVTMLIPLVNGLLTKASDSSAVKNIGTVVLNAVYALIANGMLVDGSSAFSMQTLYTAILGVMISSLTYYRIYKPLNVTSNDGGKLAAVGRH